MSGTRNWKMETRKWSLLFKNFCARLCVSIFHFPVSNFFAGRYRQIALILAAMIALLTPAAASAQGCAMCYTSASAAKKAGMEALQNGVMILLFPSLLMFAVILWHTSHSRNIQEVLDAESSLGDGFTPRSRELDAPLE